MSKMKEAFHTRKRQKKREIIMKAETSVMASPMKASTPLLRQVSTAGASEGAEAAGVAEGAVDDFGSTA